MERENGEGDRAWLISLQRHLKGRNRLGLNPSAFLSCLTPPVRFFSWTVHVCKCVQADELPNNSQTKVHPPLCCAQVMKPSVMKPTASDCRLFVRTLSLYVCVNEREREREEETQGGWRKNRERERERVWRVLAHGPAHGTSSVFVCVLFVCLRASCLS